MSDLNNNLRSAGQQLQALAKYKLELLQPKIDQVLEATQFDTQAIEHLLDELYDSALWGCGKEEYEKLLQILVQIDPKAAAFYRKELEEIGRFEELKPHPQ